MAEASEAFVELAVDNHEASHPHHDGEECQRRIAELEARIAELESSNHVHEDDELEEVEEA